MGDEVYAQNSEFQENSLDRLFDKMEEQNRKSDKKKRRPPPIEEEAEEKESRRKKNPMFSFSCNACGFSATNSGQVDRHKCTPEKPFSHKCDICGYSRREIEPLRWHKAKVHVVYDFLCEYCLHGFLDKVALTRHLRTQHLSEEVPLTLSRSRVLTLT